MEIRFEFPASAVSSRCVRRYNPRMDETRSKHTPKDSHYARLRRARMNARPSTKAGKKSERDDRSHPAPDDGLVRLYGLHSVRSAVDNPKRVIRRMLVTRNAAQRLSLPDLATLPFEAALAEPRQIERLTGKEAVHQGVVIDAEPLAKQHLSDLAGADLILVLDQVTDPHNVGAIMRSAVAFGAAAIVTTSRHSPGDSSVLAKAASGALEHIHQIEVQNLAKAIERLHQMGFQTIGLDSEAPEPIGNCFKTGKLALVLGAEGKGLRQKTRETVSHLARLDMPGPIKSLNVSNAAAISLFAARGFLGS